MKKEINIARTYNSVLNLNEKVNEIQVDQNGKPNKMSEDDKKLHGLKNIYKGKQIEYLNIYEDN
nr:alpha/beta hydrolase [Staphylococcus hominis]